MNQLHYKYHGNCQLCKATTSMTLRNRFHVSSCILHRRLEAVQSSAEELADACITLSTESPITAIETLREELGSLEFVAIYENECTRQAVGEQIRSAFEVSGTEMEAGKLWIRHRVVSESVLNCSFIEWITSGAIHENNSVNIYRMNLLVISDYNITSLKKLIELIYTSNTIIGFYIPLVCLNNEVNILKTFNCTSMLSTDSKEILRCLLKLCIIIKHRMYYFSISILALVSFRVQLWSRLLIKLIDLLNFQNEENNVKYVFGEYIIRHFYEDLRIYQSSLFITKITNLESYIIDTNNYIFSQCFNNYISYAEITVVWIIDKLAITFDEWNRLCLSCVGTLIIVPHNCYHQCCNFSLFGFCKWYRHPSFNYNPLFPITKEYNYLFENFQVLAKENPILALETFRETINTLDFDALYENEAICEQISDKVRIAMNHDDTQYKIGKLRTPHRIVGDFVIGCSFFDWFRNKTVNETLNLSPYRIHLFVINNNDYSLIQIRTLLELVYSNKRIIKGIFIPLIYTTSETFYTMFENLKIKQSPFISTYEQINLFNYVYKFSAVVFNENYYLGRYIIPLLAFQKSTYSELLPMLCQSFNIGKSDNDLKLLEEIFNILLSNLIDNVKLAASCVNEMNYEFVSKYLSNELNNDVNEFESEVTFAVFTIVDRPNELSSIEFILHFLIKTNKFCIFYKLCQNNMVNIWCTFVLSKRCA